MQSLGCLTETCIATARSINEASEVVGNVNAEPGHLLRPFIWDATLGMRDLSQLAGFETAAFVTDINNATQVVGQVRTEPRQGFIWDSVNGVRFLGTLGSNPVGNSVNDLEQVVGTSTVDGFGRAFLWDPANGTADLGTLGGRSSSGLDINEAGQVVGGAGRLLPPDSCAQKVAGYVWDSVNGMRDLNDLIDRDERLQRWTIIQAHAINDLGQILALAIQRVHFFMLLLTPISEAPPADQIAEVLAFYDKSTEDGTLVGAGPGRSGGGRLQALGNMLNTAGLLIDEGHEDEACAVLRTTLDRSDGDSSPP